MGYLRAEASAAATALGLSSAAEWATAEPCDDLNDLGDISVPRGYLGLVVADGNRMGERLATIAAYRDFSQTVRHATRQALLEAHAHTGRRLERQHLGGSTRKRWLVAPSACADIEHPIIRP